jgi:hypothetical protein
MKFVKHYLIIFVCNWKFLKSFLFRTSVSSFLVLVNVYEEKILFFLSALVKLHLTNRLNLINAESLSPFVFAEHVNTTNENVTELLRTFVVRFCTSKKSLKNISTYGIHFVRFSRVCALFETFIWKAEYQYLHKSQKN